MKPIKVMIVDDSAVVRQVLSAMLAEHPGIEVIGVAVDPLFALDKMQREWPDVLVLDVEMPRMDGITFLKKLMTERPTPVVICSTLTTAGAQTTLQALAEGAVGVIGKPGHGLKQFLHDTAEELIQAIQSAARANLSRLVPRAASRPLAELALPVAHPAQRNATEMLVAIGTSTGGTQALEAILTRLPPGCPGLLIVQHMPERFTAAFAERLNQLCRIEVLEARDGERVVAGRALIAPGGRHMLLTRSGAQYRVEVRDGPPVSRHRPSVDVLFRSVARAAGRNALGIIMTGMGDDGARGLKEMREAGARTLAQDEASCVVFGMPKEAIKLGAAERVFPLCDIPAAILASTNARGGA
ncbi:protein-glutamate methylesterase/protein-glutamine glutaminase [Pseudomonas thivervalensis]|uniref:protein-glutamate methylesterase/protein-glutamine glutaminase n=1 Tax=Pseudomonas thivervalensis TaxID=86265 RepID=UPI003D6A1552